MMSDAWVVGRHELQNIIVSLYPNKSAIVAFGLTLIILGLVAPIGIASGWLDSTGYLFAWFWLTWLLIAGPSSDAFAGERERHTLAYLLSTRLSSGAILFGKITAVSLYGFALSMIAVLVSAVILTVSSEWSQSRPAFHFLYSVAFLTPFASLLAATTGILVSLSMRSPRQAQQAITIIAPAVMALAIVVRGIVSLISPSLLQTYARCTIANPCRPYMISIVALLMLFLSAVIYWLANIRIDHIRRRPS